MIARHGPRGKRGPGMHGWATPSIVRPSRANLPPYFAAARGHFHHVSAVYLAGAVPRQTPQPMTDGPALSAGAGEGSSSYYTYRRERGLSTGCALQLWTPTRDRGRRPGSAWSVPIPQKRGAPYIHTA